MNVHKNARLTPQIRAELVRRVLVAGQVPVTVAVAVAIAMGVTTKTVRKRVERFVAEDKAGLADKRPVAACWRSSPGITVGRRTSSVARGPGRAEIVAALLPGPA